MRLVLLTEMVARVLGKTSFPPCVSMLCCREECNVCGIHKDVRVFIKSASLHKHRLDPWRPFPASLETFVTDFQHRLIPLLHIFSIRGVNQDRFLNRSSW